MPENARRVRGDSRSEELAALNTVEIAPQPEEIRDWAEDNPIYIFNVSPYPLTYEHPLVGRLTVAPCEPGEQCSKPTVLKGLIPYGVRTEMRTAELRHESGKKFALDVLQLGPFMKKEQSPLHMGIFIASEDTFDPNDPMKWAKSGRCGKKPTAAELKAANERFAAWDFALIAAGDRHFGEGPTQPTTPHMGHSNISAQMRDACTRRGQNREWNRTLESLKECPGCGERVRPGIKKHVACGWRFDLNRFEGEAVATK